MLFETMDLYRTLNLKSNPVNSSHFENNFKRTINCPATRVNMDEPSEQYSLQFLIMLRWKTSWCAEAQFYWAEVIKSITAGG